MNAAFDLEQNLRYRGNIIIDSKHNVLSVIDWENAIAAPWEIVEFAKDISYILQFEG